MKKKVLFRADGNSSIGLGHLYRLFSVVEICKDEFDFVFITREDSELTIIPSIYNLMIIPVHVSYEDELEWIEKRIDIDSCILIADGYQFQTEYQKKIKDRGIKLIYIDDLVSWHMHADVIINHSLGYTSEDYSSESYTTFCLGTDYALLRPNFIEESKKNRVVKKLDSIFVCFGGADPCGLTVKAVKAIIELNRFLNVHIVLGGAYKKLNELKELVKGKSFIKIYDNLSELEILKVMKSCDLAISPSSTILYELCSVKMPILSGFYVDNQKKIYHGFLENGSIFGLGDISNYDTGDFIEALSRFLIDANFLDYCVAQGHLFDGKVKERILKIIKDVI